MAEGKEDWVSSLRQFNARVSKEPAPENLLEGGGDTVEDRKLLEECYVKLKGKAGNKYSVLPKFYSKVLKNVKVSILGGIFSLMLLGSCRLLAV